jgi:hypothetical protein
MQRPDVTRRPPGHEPDSRLASHITAATPPPQGQTTICIVADLVATAVDLIAEKGARERQAYERGVLYGVGQGWDQRGAYETDRGAA